MQIHSKSRYAVMSLIYLAQHNDEAPVSLSAISMAQNIDRQYLEQIFYKLKQANIVVSCRGPGGGYKLNGSAGDINLLDILSVFEDNAKINKCNDSESRCLGKSKCNAHNVWNYISKKINGIYKEISLQDMLHSSYRVLENE